MLTEICKEINNFFCRPEDIRKGTFTISGKAIEPLEFLQENQYFRIIGSALNDGVYKYPATDQLKDEVFEGAIWPMKVPPAVIDLDEKITASELNDKRDGYVSQSFGGWSGTLATGDNGAPATWKEKYAAELNLWRRV